MATPHEQLKTYRSKRDFTKTAEPAGARAKRATKGTPLRFIVQKHDATRLHYDFRLELDGVLKSWAITRGPSTNPADKRLAVRVEDHPLDYATFEGTIPEGEYGGGTVMLWDEGTWEPVGDPHDGLDGGDLKFTLGGKRMKGEWVLVHMKGRDNKTRNGTRENWLLIKHRDRYATESDGLIEKFTTSVETGRSLDGISKGLKSRKKTVPGAEATKPKRRAKLKSMQLTNDMGIELAERRKLRLTSPDRPVLPDETVTKARLFAYYDAVATRMLPHIEKRALSLVRVPHGSKPFFQKHDTGGFPETMQRVAIELKESERQDHFYVTDIDGVLAGVQMSTLEFHIWGSRIGKTLEQPDRIIFDIDPDEGLGFDRVKDAALHIREVLGEWGLESFPMLTGGKGIHVIAPLKPVTEWPLVKLFCRTFAEKLEQNEPENFTANIRKVKREGRMFVDYLRNERGATAVTPFSTRAKPGIPCAVPVAWDEFDALKAASQFDIEAAADRARQPDPWRHYFDLTQSITKGMVEAVAGPLKDLNL